MATLGHLAIGMAAGRAATPDGRSPLVPMAIYGALACFPDLDLLAFRLGIPYAATWGHRGAVHSLGMAAALGVVAFAITRRSAHGWRLSLLAFAVLVSHVLLDAVTRGGLGVAAFWPLAAKRYFAPVRFIPVAPIGPTLWASARGRAVLAFEVLAFAPFWLYALWPRRQERAAGRARAKRSWDVAPK